MQCSLDSYDWYYANALIGVVHDYINRQSNLKLIFNIMWACNAVQTPTIGIAAMHYLAVSMTAFTYHQSDIWSLTHTL